MLGCCIACSPSAVVFPQVPALRVTGALPKDDRPAGTLYKDELQAAVAAGLGHFLQSLEVRAVTREDDLGQRVFAGFQIVALRPAERWLKFDFVPGDIVTRVDGVSVEHYDAVLPMFEGLVAKDRFEVRLVRGGEERVVVIHISDRATEPVAATRGK